MGYIDLRKALESRLGVTESSVCGVLYVNAMSRYLQAGMMDGGLVSPRSEGTPQGGPLSPLLSNCLLDELDKELERRGHRFARYADDCNVYVQSEAAGIRVMASLECFLEKRLRLKVNREKSASRCGRRQRDDPALSAPGGKLRPIPSVLRAGARALGRTPVGLRCFLFGDGEGAGIVAGGREARSNVATFSAIELTCPLTV